MLSGTLLAMQAAGMVIDYSSMTRQQKLMNMGSQLEQASLDANLEQTKLQTEEESLQSMKQLRQTMGTQLAVMSARGTSPSAGSAFSILTESQGNFNSDERVRRLNALGKENQLRANSAVKRLQYSSDVSKMWQGFASRSLNRLSTSGDYYKELAKEGYGLTSLIGSK